MFKLLFVVTILVCLRFTQFGLCNPDTDEFAEFDELIQESPTHQNAHASSISQESSKQASQSKDATSNKRILDSPINKDNVNDLNPDMSEKDAGKASQTKPDLKLVNAPLPRIYKLESYYIEFAFLLASILYLVNYFAGSSKNHKFAQQWYDNARVALKEQFSLVGGPPTFSTGTKKSDDEVDQNQTNAKKQRGLIKSTESMYTVWSSGRVGMDGLLIEINLLKRQDLFSMALSLLKPSKDSIVLRFLLNQEGYENFVFCLSHKVQAQKLARDMVDINTFCPKRKVASQCGVESDRLFVMSELTDVTSFILDQKAAQFIKKYEQSLNFIHITDQFSTVRTENANSAQKLANPKRMATFSFAFPKSTSDWNEYLHFSLYLLDRLRRFKLARDSKQKSDKNRQRITDILQKSAFSQRQEAAQAKKEELRRQEKERIYNEDDPEKQKRWEKKEAKREQKKNKMRVKQLKVKAL